MMSEHSQSEGVRSVSLESWGTPLVPLICEACDWRYLAPAGPASTDLDARTTCPHCAAEAVVRLDPDEAQFPYVAPPELIVPFSASQGAVDARVTTFAQGIPYAPEDLNPDALRARLQRLYLPMWLVDSDVQAQWQAEVGFDYQVVSHQERYADGAGWRTDEVHEGRVRWEPRLGRLQRHYDNVAAPALAQHALLARALGAHATGDVVRYRSDLLAGAVVRAPDRGPDAAWPEADAAVRQAAAEECRQAAAADHIRDFRWSPHYAARHWTLLLLPVYATYYRDDEGAPQRVLINGQTGQLYGAKRGSMARASRLSLIIGIVALVIFVVGLALALFSALFPPLLLLGVLGAVIGLMVAVGAVAPVTRVWAFNRQQAKTPEEV